MPRRFKFELPERLRGKAAKEPRFIARVVLGTLLVANLIAAYAVFQPVGGSAEELEAEITTLRSDLQRRQAALAKMRTLVAKIEQARTTGDEFLTQYFTDRRTASSAIVSELDVAAKEAGMRPKERSFAYDPVEGSDTLSMMTVVANYEGTYGDLLQFVNRLDKSARFLILDTLTASPQQGGGVLNVQVKFNTFVRESA
jgi:type IV pilus assembly protein PilO